MQQKWQVEEERQFWWDVKWTDRRPPPLPPLLPLLHMTPANRRTFQWL